MVGMEVAMLRSPAVRYIYPAQTAVGQLGRHVRVGRDVQSLQDRAQVHASPIDIWWER